MPYGFVTRVVLDYDQTEVTVAALAGALSLTVEWPDLFDAFGATVDVNGTFCAIDSVNEETGVLTLLDPIPSNIDVGDPVYVVAGGQRRTYLTASVDLGEGDDADVRIPYSDRDLWPEGDYDVPVPVVLSDDCRTITETPGRIPMRDGRFINADTVTSAILRTGASGARVEILTADNESGTRGAVRLHTGQSGWTHGVAYGIHNAPTDTGSVFIGSPYLTADGAAGRSFIELAYSTFFSRLALAADITEFSGDVTVGGQLLVNPPGASTPTLGFKSATGLARTSVGGNDTDVDSALVWVPAGFRMAKDTDASTRTSLDAANIPVSLDFHGAIGNDAADDTVAVQAAIDHAIATNRPLWVPPRTFRVTTLDISAGLVILGVPGKSVIRAHPSKSRTVAMVKTASAAAPVRTVQNLHIEGVTFSGGLLPAMRWLQTPDGLTTITNPEADYYHATNNPNGKIGNPAFPNYDVDDLVADGRRNPNYTQTAPLIDLALCENAVIRGCTFKNHYGVGIQERGGLNVTVENCHFDNVGKDDGPYMAIWTQSFGVPGNGDPWYQDSENIVIRANTFRNLERGAVLFAPTKGGQLVDNHVVNVGEFGLFLPANINRFGGHTLVQGNTIKTVRVRDIVANGIELNSARNLTIRDNYVEDTDGCAIVTEGSYDLLVEGNVFRNCYRTHTLPYGPFSERYGWAQGTAPIAGEVKNVTDGNTVGIGSQGASGSDRVTIARNRIQETRGSYPALFKQTKSGSNNIAQNVVIEDNLLDVPAGMVFLDTSIGGVWATTMPLSIRGNRGHASESPVVVEKQWAAGETGLHTVTPGFRPRSVRVYAAPNGTTLGRIAIGEFSWTRNGVRNDFDLTLSTTSGTGQTSAIRTTKVIRITDSANADRMIMDFSAWTETGFTVNVTTNLDITNVRFVCTP